MHFMKGLNISKKIFKILSKQFKSKINPSAMYPYEPEKYSQDLSISPNYLDFHLKNSINSFSSKMTSSKSDNKVREITKYYFKNLVMSTSNFFFLYIVLKNKNMKMTNEKKKVQLGCSVKVNDVGLNKGMKIISVKVDSAAEKANLQVGDVILKVNNTEVNSIEQFTYGIRSGELKSKKLKILRGNEELNVEVNFQEETEN